MMKIRKASQRGSTRTDWLDSRHTFSFADYYDPAQMGFRTLRVVNDDRVAPASGFGLHSHANMEILTWVVEGALQHRDSLGTGSVIRSGELQRMSAGTGVDHSEMNPSETEAVRFLQIWITPDERGLEPGYEQRTVRYREREGRLKLIASRDGRDGSVTVHQDVALYTGVFASRDEATLELAPNRHAWVQVVRGSLVVNGERLSEGDGAALSREERVHLQADGLADVLVFDLA